MVPAVVSFRLIGKRFTLYSCLMIALTSVLTDLIPSMPLTNDVLLVCIFGGIVNGLAISLCLLGRATSGGTDFISVALSERLGVDAWNYIFFANCGMLAVAGLLFGWDKALYSIIFQFASTQVVHMLDPRFKRTTLFIISNRAQEVYEQIQGYDASRATRSTEPACITARSGICCIRSSRAIRSSRSPASCAISTPMRLSIS